MIKTDNLFNDLWRFNVATRQWGWMRGSNSPNSQGNPGTIGVPSASIDPGATYEMAAWTEDNGASFWFYGGCKFSFISVGKRTESISNLFFFSDGEVWSLSICGDGAISTFEECDAGIDDYLCCEEPLCTIASADLLCRSSQGECDVSNSVLSFLFCSFLTSRTSWTTSAMDYLLCALMQRNL
jgi:hypothetical protein